MLNLLCCFCGWVAGVATGLQHQEHQQQQAPPAIVVSEVPKYETFSPPPVFVNGTPLSRPKPPPLYSPRPLYPKTYKYNESLI